MIEKMSEAEAGAAIAAILAPWIQEANRKRFKIDAFVKRTYSNPIAGVVALVCALKNLERAAAAMGVDASRVIEWLMEHTSPDEGSVPS